jgi:Asp-tRNA(Asn)/Glu-tRNA(Gln) amidotransferase B subunit
MQVLGFFIGDIMKKTSGRANPQLLNKLLREYLDGNNN